MATVEYEVSEGIATVTLNRPEKLNAVDLDTEELLHERLRSADADPDVRCIVLTGAGRGFCAGDDVTGDWGSDRMDESVADLGGPSGRLARHVETFLYANTPSIAAVNGVAAGHGMDLALLCDICIASEDARFGQLFVKMGLVPDIGGTWLLPQLVGRSHAAEILFTGDLVDAREAERMGLVSRVVPRDELLPTAYALAKRIAANPPLAVTYIKEGLRRAAGRSVDQLPDLTTILGMRLHRLFSTDDHKEAVRAFTEKRTPTFRGR